MRRLAFVVLTSCLILSMTGCNRPAEVPEVTLATSVAGTMTAQAVVVPPTADVAPPPTTAPGTGSIAGRICYPSEGIPPMTLYLQNTADRSVSQVAIAQNQSSFSAELAPGAYYAYAWLPGFAIGGAYTPAVPCGLAASCTDHSLLPVTVAAGQAVAGVDVCDWYGGPGAVPLPPGVAPTATSAPPPSPIVPTNTGTAPGGISGTFTYPGSIPIVVVLAFNLDTPYWWWVGTGSGQSWYSFDEIPPGRYQVIGYATSGLEASYGGGATVTVGPAQFVEGIDLSDWRPAGTYRSKPSGIDYP